MDEKETVEDRKSDFGSRPDTADRPNDSEHELV